MGRDGKRREDLRNKEVQPVKGMLDVLRRLEEAERKEEMKRSSSSQRGTISTTRSHRGTSAGSVDDDKVIRIENLKKQGGKVKSWHTRFFVLRRRGLYYYRDEASFRANHPLGRILFCDMISLTNKNSAAEEVPSGIHLLIGLKYVFCVFTETRTYTIAAPTRQSQEEWVRDINNAYHKFQKSVKKKNALMNNVWRVGDDDVYTLAAQLTKNDADVDVVLDNMLEVISEGFAEEVAKAYLLKQKQMIFIAWKAFTRYSVGQRPDKQIEERKNVQGHRDFFTKRLSQKIAKRLSLTKR